STAKPARHAVVREHQLSLVADAEQPDERGQSQLVWMNEIEAESIESQNASAIQHVGVIAKVRGATAMADHDMPQVNAFRRENVELFAPHRAVLSMCGDGRAGT